MNKDKIKSLCRQYQDGVLRVDKFMEALEQEGIPCWVTFVISDLHREVSYLTNVGKLDEDDQKVARKWREEHEKRRQILNKLDDVKNTDVESYMAVLKEYTDTGKDRCEHDRSIWTPCAACLHIEETLYPDMVGDEDDDC